MHPRQSEIGSFNNKHGYTKYHGQNHSWPGDDVPKLFLHDLKLCLKDSRLIFISIEALRMIDEQAYNVE
jgi:hypothetical protein